MNRYYVTVTWDNWPEGGSYGTAVEAETPEQAEEAAKMEMAETQVENDPGPDDFYLEGDQLVTWIYEQYADSWHLVDCFDLDEFIEHHGKKG